MNCRRCASSLERPGDYCLVCRTQNADSVVLDVARDHAEITMLRDETVVGKTGVRTTPEEGEREVVELRNFAGRIADEVRRKHPEEVYAAGDRDVIRAVRAQLHYDFYRVGDENPVEEVLARRGERSLEVVDLDPAEKIGGTHTTLIGNRDGMRVIRAVRATLHYDFYRVGDEDPVEEVLARRGEPSLEVVELDPSEKLGGSHTTLIGNRDGMRVIREVACHPHVKKIIPGPISAGGSSSDSGVTAKATRADENGNVRILLRDGSSVQENRVVTTAMDRDLGERIREDLNDALREGGFQ